MIDPNDVIEVSVKILIMSGLVLSCCIL